MGKRKHEKRTRSGGSDDQSRSSGSGASSADERVKKSKKHSKKDKKHKKHKHKDKGKDKLEDMVEQAKRFLKSQLAGGEGAPSGSQGPAQAPLPGPPPTLPPDKRITDDDYFIKNAEFTAWLQESKRVMFNELTTEQAHTMFAEFVAMYNAGLLAPQLYSGAVVAPMRRTTHQWAFKAGGQPPGPALGMAAFMDDQADVRKTGRAADRVEQKRWRADQKELLDELLPRATGREALVEKRLARREDAWARDASPDAMRLPGGMPGDIYGGDDSLTAAKAREERRGEAARHRAFARAEAAAATIAAQQAKEEERLAPFRALLAQGPIAIPKRNQG